MRNKYPGICYKCGKLVPKGKGHFERYFGSWRVQCFNHASKIARTESEQYPIKINNL